MNQPGKNIPFEDARRLLEKLERLETENKRLEQENRLLREKVDFILRRMFGSSSEKLHPGQLELMLSLQEEAQAAGKGEASLLLEGEAVPAKPRAKRERRERVPEHLPVVEEILEPEEVAAEPEQWRRIGEERTELLDCEPARYVRRVIIRPKYVSRQDKEAAPVNKSPSSRPPDGPRPAAGNFQKLPDCRYWRCRGTGLRHLHLTPRKQGGAWRNAYEQSEPRPRRHRPPPQTFLNSNLKLRDEAVFGSRAKNPVKTGFPGGRQALSAITAAVCLGNHPRPLPFLQRRRTSLE